MSTVVIDLETQSLAADRDASVPVWCIGLLFESACSGNGVYGWGRIDRDWLQGVLDENTVIFHNAAFDLAVLELHGFKVKDFEDTCLMSYIWNPGGQHSLAAWGEKLNFPKDAHTDFSQDSKELRVYCQRDLTLTSQIFTYHQKFQKDTRAYQLYQLEKEYTRLIIQMNQTGFYLDNSKLQRLRERLVTESSGYHQQMIDTCPLVPKDLTALLGNQEVAVKEYKRPPQPHFQGPFCEYVEMNPCSTAHRVWVLQSKHQWIPTKLTETGKPALDEEVVQSLEFPFAKLISEYSETHKILSTYIQPFVDQQLAGRINTHFNQTVTLTGRLSSSNPFNFQNIPANGRYGDLIRECIVAPAQHKIVGVDLAAIEARVLAHYLFYCLGDRQLTDAIVAGLDIHTFNADILGVSRPEAKTFLYAYLYGAGATKLGKGDKAKGKALLDKVTQRFPALVQLKQLLITKCRDQRGVIHTWFGRRLVYPDILSADEQQAAKAQRQVFNAVLQGTAADLLKILTLAAMPLLAELGAQLVASIHDEVLFYVPAAHAERAREVLNCVFNNEGVLSHCPVAGVAKVGETWQQVH